MGPPFKFSTRSNTALDTAHPSLGRVFRKVILSRDCTILIGHREKEAQNEAVRTGHSTKLWPTGKHNRKPSLAVDAAPCDYRGRVDWSDKVAFYEFAGYVSAVATECCGLEPYRRGEAIGPDALRLRRGLDWDGDLDLHDQSLYDLVHWEIVEGPIPRHTRE